MKIVNRVIYWFKLKKFKSTRIHNARFICDPNYDIGVKEYYPYICKLLIHALHGLEEDCIIFFGIHQLKLPPQNVPVIFIDLQIEHTLVKAGGRGSENSPIGKVGFQDDSGVNYVVRIANYKNLIKQDIVIDYSCINLTNIKLSGHYKEYLKKVFLIAPTLYDLKSYSSHENRQYDTITLFRNPDEPRRKQFIQILNKRNVKFENLNNIFENLDSVYLNTKILINIRQTDFHDTLEELRILPALRCGVIVISEDAPLKEYCMYSEFILWDKLENLPDLILDVQNNYEAYHKKIFLNTKFYTRMNRLSKANELSAFKIRKEIESILKR
jgi:hypothetical protein